MQFAWGFAPPLILEVAIRNRVFDFLDAAEHSVEEVAELTNGSIRGWRAILNCLVGLDFFDEEEWTLPDDAGKFDVPGYNEAHLHRRFL